VHTVPLVAKLLATAEYEQVVRQVSEEGEASGAKTTDRGRP
jgi:hypothetical protein